LIQILAEIQIGPSLLGEDASAPCKDGENNKALRKDSAHDEITASDECVTIHG
jgi:hypothetical protein